MRAPATALALGAALLLSSAPADAAAGRGYELVSFPSAGSNTGLGSFAEPGTLAPHWAPVTADGSVLLGSNTAISGEPAGVASNNWLATRTPTGWTRTYVGMPTSRNAFAGTQNPLTYSADLRSSAWSETSQAGTDPADPSPIRTGPPIPQYFSLLWRTGDGITREQFAGGHIQGSDVPSANAELSADGSTLTFAATGLVIPPAAASNQVYQRFGASLRALGNDGQGRELAEARLIATNPSGTRVLLSGVDVDGNGALFVWSGDSNTLPIPIGSSGVTVAVDDALRTATVITRERLTSSDTDDAADLYDIDLTSGQATLLTRGDQSGGDTSDPATCVAPLAQSQVGGGFVGDCDVAWFKGRPGEITYFESPEVLDGASDAVAGDTNVYWVRDGQVHFAFRFDPIRTAGGADTILSTNRGFTVDPSGALVFSGSLVAGSTDDAGSLAEAQRFDPATGKVACLSCTGDGTSTTADAELQPQQRGYSSRSGTDVTSDGGLVYLTTAQALSPEDTNRTRDVYEYDVRSGTRTLISPGDQDVDAWFSGVGPDGTDVFFSTRQTLVGGDQNGPVWKVYDARRGGGFPEPAPVVPCQGDACRPASPPPPPPGSVATAAGQPVSAANPQDDDSDLALTTPTSKALRTFVRTGKLRVTITRAGSGESLHVRLNVTPRVYATADTTARNSKVTATLRLTRARRLALSELVRHRSVPATLTVRSRRSDAGDDASLTLPKTSRSTR